MLKVYVNSDIKYERLNDNYFNMYTALKVIDSKELQSIMENNEGVKYLGNGKVLSKISGTEIGIECISTGVKTLLNVLAFPDKVFYISECGSNIKEVIFDYNVGNIYSDFVCYYPDVFKPHEIIYKNKSYMCDTIDEVDRCYKLYAEDCRDGW